MSGFSSIYTAVSGLQAAQLGLSVTGHNMSNSEIAGYSRQRIIQRDFFYQTIGQSNYGALKRGLGTDTGTVHQIRNEYLDFTYRTQNGKLNFYAVKSVAGSEIEGLLGEMQGSYKFQDVINDMWYAMQELSAHPDGIETRDFFRATCESFIVKSNEVYNSLYEYQHNLDTQIRGAVKEVNGLVARVNELNGVIGEVEATGDKANDYRDERNRCLDKLSSILPIDYSEGDDGKISIFTDGHQLLAQNSQKLMGLRYINGDYSFVEPVFTSSTEILPADTPPSEFEAFMNYNRPINALRDNDYGSLKGMMAARGTRPAYYNRAEGLYNPKPPNDPPLAADYDPASFPVAADYVVTPGYPDGSKNPAYIDKLAEYYHYYPAFKDGVESGEYTIDGTRTSFDQFIADNPTADEIAARIFANDVRNFKELYPASNLPAPFAPTPDDWDNYNAAAYNYKANVWSIENCMIPKTMIALDSIVHNVVTMVNDSVAPYVKGANGKDPNAPFDLNHIDGVPDDQPFVEVFVRDHMSRWDEGASASRADDLYNGEMQGNYYSQYSIGNISINPILTNQEDGYNYLAFSSNGDKGNNDVILDMLDKWTDPNGPYSVQIDGVTYTIQDAYQKSVTTLATEFEEANNYVENQTTQVVQAENERQSVMGVSLDEEMSNMMKYQYAYQSAARILNVVDSMIDVIVNRLVG